MLELTVLALAAFEAQSGSSSAGGTLLVSGSSVDGLLTSLLDNHRTTSLLLPSAPLFMWLAARQDASPRCWLGWVGIHSRGAAQLHHTCPRSLWREFV